MFDGLLKSKFYSKCKSDIKLTRTRVDMIMKKRNAMQKYLRNDVADLLKNGLDTNAYGRAEGLLVELSKTSCYEFIEQCSVCVSSHLSAMDKQRECPEECREAVSSLMFAAARFADLPELRELRTIFFDRYGNSLDCLVNKQFVEKLKSGLPSKDLKLQLLQDVALESGLEWNSKALENKLYNEAASQKNAREVTAPERKKDLSYNGPTEATKTEDRRLSNKRTESALPFKDIQVDTIRRNENPNKTASLRSDPNEEEIENEKPLKFKSIPPPYTKSEVKSSSRDEEKNHDQEDLTGKNTKPIPKSVRRRNPRPRQNQENACDSTGNEEEKMKDVNKEKAAQAQKILKYFDKGSRDEEKEEEKIVDKLLRYYSRINGPREKGKSEINAPTESSKATKPNRGRDCSNRSMSLPGETTPDETPKTHNRASSFQPEMLNGNHVHPKLPDYDDFVARLAASRGN
ncbi:hypothetical protein ACJIZ3_025491 [Penstemon smallii]|uniref:Regulator of Vps4 activity in the MVB pathway protein n=1 Tax=Penstemon smallii TaxID=265156 RepID=A0ABD3TVR5_9LAMI